MHIYICIYIYIYTNRMFPNGTSIFVAARRLRKLAHFNSERRAFLLQPAGCTDHHFDFDGSALAISIKKCIYIYIHIQKRSKR